MPANYLVYLLGLAIGSGLLFLGGLLGYWLGKKSVPISTVDRQQFLSFLRNLANWTNEYAGDVSRYQTQLVEIDQKFRTTDAAVPIEIVQTLREIIDVNRQLQLRLDSAEHKLDLQTNQISNVLAEARTDGLTGLLNRKAFDQSLDRLFGQWSRQGTGFSMGLIDIDHFKQINDMYGHPAGDAVLRQISQLLQVELAQEVCVARYGGEEFAVLSTASGEKLAAVLEQVRQQIAQFQIQADSQLVSVTLSAGAAEVTTQDKICDLVRRADDALYEAKTHGRNRVYGHNLVECILVTQETATHLAAENSVVPQSAAKIGVLPSDQEDRAQLAAAKVRERLQRIVEEESQRLIQR